jgi:hypothetical protein
MGICGDWLVSPNVEGAALSGIALAEKMSANMRGSDRSSVGLDCKFRALESHAVGDFGSRQGASGSSRPVGEQPATAAAAPQQRAEPQQQRQLQQQQGQQPQGQQQQAAAALTVGPGNTHTPAVQQTPAGGPCVAQQISELQAKLADLSGPAARNARKRLHKKLEALQQGAAAVPAL